MDQEDFPDVTPEPTSILWNVANERPCPECGKDTWSIPRPGDVRIAICRDCRLGYSELLKHANYGVDWGKVREWVLDRDGYQCWDCGDEDSLHVHHIHKIVWFETTKQAHRPDNLVTLCEQCHRELEYNPDHFQEV